LYYRCVGCAEASSASVATSSAGPSKTERCTSLAGVSTRAPLSVPATCYVCPPNESSAAATLHATTSTQPTTKGNRRPGISSANFRPPCVSSRTALSHFRSRPTRRRRQRQPYRRMSPLLQLGRREHDLRNADLSALLLLFASQRVLSFF